MERIGDKMGLDMFLYGVEYHSEYDEEEDNDKSYYVMTEEIYWRKANQIHRWFVENIQHNIDNCAMYYVSKMSLCELKELCEKVLEDKKLADELLPIGRGFFFGSAEYDEWYFKDLEYTVEKLDELLKNEDYDFYKYQSDW